MKRIRLKGLLAAFTLAFELSLNAAQLTVFAAASLTDSLKEIAASYEKQTGDTLAFNFAGSSLLARQIEEGAPADLFLSADEVKMNVLDQKGLVVAETRKAKLSNTLVIVVAAEKGASLQHPRDLSSPNILRIALAEPRTVPAGIYAKDYLQKQKLWAELERKVIPTQNVRAALAAVESGNVDAAIVYKTDAAISRKVRVAYEIPTSETPSIRYSFALLKNSKSPESAVRFLAHLDSPEAAKVFRRFGFIINN